MQPPQGREGGPANFSRQLRIYFRDRFCIAANTSGYVSLAGDRIDRVVVFAAIGESEAIAGEQKIDDLARPSGLIMLRLADPAMIQNQRSAGSPWRQICWRGEQREIEARGARASNCREPPGAA